MTKEGGGEEEVLDEEWSLVVVSWASRNHINDIQVLHIVITSMISGKELGGAERREGGGDSQIAVARMHIGVRNNSWFL